MSRPQAGFILWLELPESIDTLELFHQAMDEKSYVCREFCVRLINDLVIVYVLQLVLS